MTQLRASVGVFGAVGAFAFGTGRGGLVSYFVTRCKCTLDHASKRVVGDYARRDPHEPCCYVVCIGGGSCGQLLSSYHGSVNGVVR